jgi:hypothetical protein
MMKLSKPTMLSILLMVIVAGAALATVVIQDQTQPAITYTEALYATDVSDPRQLAGITENVFVGRVVSFNETHYPDLIPETLFTVEVLDNIKGELKAEVVVNQQGGHWQADENGNPGELHLVNEDAMLIVGQTYLFATLPDAEGQWHTLVPVYGDIPLKDDSHRAEVTAVFEDAVQNQVIYDLNDYAQD